ncbi:MAG: tRNA epoxyqueuosine(34) reductase QueG [Bacteroidota bacterium]|nr:tRNA epoxyqueuosine(34) reductase QueG [Bacteroidota bacterium]
MSLKENHTKLIKKTAALLGFDYCGISKAVFLEEDARRLENWLNKGYNGKMQYMDNYFDLRTNPTLLVPGAKSVITLLKNYFPSEKQQNDNPKIAKYAYGKDYHEVIREILKHFLSQLELEIGEINGRGFVDSAPVLERAWAVKSGLGWIGKNGNLITKTSGSFYFIATLIVDIELAYDDPYTKDYCGSCNKCINACPTNAILPNKVIDGSKCISYFTIELKDALINEDMKGKFDNWMFGCDTCQDVCPWNRFSQPNTEKAFTPIPAILNLSTTEWEAMTEDAFKEIFRHSPLKRSKFKGIQRNLKFLKQ